MLSILHDFFILQFCFSGETGRLSCYPWTFPFRNVRSLLSFYFFVIIVAFFFCYHYYLQSAGAPISHLRRSRSPHVGHNSTQLHTGRAHPTVAHDIPPSCRLPFRRTPARHFPCRVLLLARNCLIIVLLLFN